MFHPPLGFQQVESNFDRHVHGNGCLFAHRSNDGVDLWDEPVDAFGEVGIRKFLQPFLTLSELFSIGAFARLHLLVGDRSILSSDRDVVLYGFFAASVHGRFWLGERGSGERGKAIFPQATFQQRVRAVPCAFGW